MYTRFRLMVLASLAHRGKSAALQLVITYQSVGNGLSGQLTTFRIRGADCTAQL